MELCVLEIRAWMLCDKLKINNDKTEVIIIRTRQQQAKAQVVYLTVGDARVPFVSAVKHLGTWSDTNLSLQVHINDICKAEYYHLTNIRRIRKYLSTKATRKLVHALIRGRINYCNSILYGFSSLYIAKLQSLQNSAARLIFNIPRFSHITPA